MKALDILKQIGVGIISANPLGAAALGIVNSFLPDDKKLPDTATGEQALQVVEKMSGAERASIELANIDLEKTEVESEAKKYEVMCKADGQETRAKIVNKAMNCLIAISLIFIAAIAVVYYISGAVVAFSYEMMAVYLAVSGTFTYVIRAYFGDLKSETKSRHNALNKIPEPSKGLAGLIQAIKSGK